MIVEKSLRFNDELAVIINFIAEDSLSRALNFLDELTLKMKNVPDNPLIHRKKESLNDENIRELIYKGYTIPFYIDVQNNKIIILGIFNQNIWQ